MNILVTPGNWTASLAIMENLAKKGHHIFLLDSDFYCAGFRSKYCKKGIVVPPEAYTNDYLQAIEELVVSRNFDLLIPTSDISTELLSSHRERFIPYVRMLLPSKEHIKLARFKNETYQFCLEHDINIPQTYFPSSWPEVVEAADSIVFPCVVKKPRGTANKGNAYFYNKESLKAQYGSLITKDGWPVIQEYIRGDFYGFLGVADRGDILDCAMYKTLQEYATGGMAPYCYSVRDQEFLETAKRIVKLLGWTGAINIDFLRSPEGSFYMLEINPRLSGSLTFAHFLGVELAEAYLWLAFGRVKRDRPMTKYKANIGFRYVLPSEIKYALDGKTSFLKVLLNFFKFHIKTDIPWNDPDLLISQLCHMWWYRQDKSKDEGGKTLAFTQESTSKDPAEDSEHLHALCG